MEKPASDKCLFLRHYSMCAQKVLHQVNASLTTHKLLLADGEHAPALQHLRVGAAGIDAGQEGLFCHPDRKPLELAVAQQAGCVQASARAQDTRKILFTKQ